MLEDLRGGQAALEDVAIRAGSTPALAARTSASETASMTTATTTWLQTLATWPAPEGPTWTIVFPSAWSTGCARSKAASLPPTMIESVPAIAPLSPPLTGASSISAPAPSASAASSRATRGAIELMSMASQPGRAAASAPSGPR